MLFDRNFICFFILLCFTKSLVINSQESALKLAPFYNNLNSIRQHNNPFENFSNIVNNIFTDIINETANDLTEKCNNSMQIALNFKNQEYSQKLIRDSSKNINDLSSYDDCIGLEINLNSSSPKNSILYNITYIIVQFNKNEEKRLTKVYEFEEGYCFGICIRKNCTENDYKKITLTFNKYLDNILNINSSDNLTITDVLAHHDERFSYLFWVKLIPFIIYLFLLIVSIFPKIFVCMFKCCCFKKKINSSTIIIDKDTYFKTEGRNSNHQINYSPSSIETVSNLDSDTVNDFLQCFNRFTNIEELFNMKTQINNDSGLSFLLGLRAMSLIYLLLGLVYMIILNSPLKKYYPNQNQDLMKNILFHNIVIGLRISPKMLFALSGFSLCYKFICYLEDKSENEKTILIKSFRKNSSNDITYEMISRRAVNEFKEKHHNNVINWSVLKYFISLRIYKVFFYLMSVIIFYFSFYEIFNLFGAPRPMWVYFYTNTIGKILTNCSINQLFMTSYFLCNHEVNVFWIIQNEILFYIIGVLVIFLLYKYQLRLDLFFIASIILILFFKIFIFCFTFNDDTLNYFSLIISNSNCFYRTMTNPLINLIYYLIGCFFALVNFVIQKSITPKIIFEGQKTFLLIPLKFVNFFSVKPIVKLSIMGLFFLGFFMIDVFSYTIFSDYVIDNKASLYVNLFYLFDIELIVSLLFFTLIGFIVAGENFIIPFLSNKNWLFFSRQYYTNVFLIYYSIYYIIYSTESRINLDMLSIFFYFCICFCLHNIFITFNYIFLEIPYKRLNKLFLKTNSVKEEKSF